MNRQERVEAVAAGGGESRAASGELGNAVSGIVAGALTKGDAVRLVGFSRLPVGERVAPTGHNLLAGAEIEVPVRLSVTFAAAKAVKEAVNGS